MHINIVHNCLCILHDADLKFPFIFVVNEKTAKSSYLTKQSIKDRRQYISNIRLQVITTKMY